MEISFILPSARPSTSSFDSRPRCTCKPSTARREKNLTPERLGHPYRCLDDSRRAVSYRAADVHHEWSSQIVLQVASGASPDARRVSPILRGLGRVSDWVALVQPPV